MAGHIKKTKETISRVLLTQLAKSMLRFHRRATGKPGTRYVPQAVSRYFHLDWNYALRIVRIQFLTWLSPLIFATGVLSTYFPVGNIHISQVACLWGASASFLLGYAILRVRAPLFLQEYRNFKEYEDMGHSHRWILWQFNTYVPRLKDVERERIIQELVDKEMAMPVSSQQCDKVYRVCPLLPPPTTANGQFFGPVNLNTDLYLTFWLANTAYVVPVQESDPGARERQRELFWILYSRCADTRPAARTFVWLLFVLAGALAITAAIIVLYKIFTTPALPGSVVV